MKNGIQGANKGIDIDKKQRTEWSKLKNNSPSENLKREMRAYKKLRNFTCFDRNRMTKLSFDLTGRQRLRLTREGERIRIKGDHCLRLSVAWGEDKDVADQNMADRWMNKTTFV